MKSTILITIFLFISITAFGKKSYHLSKEEFIDQFNDSVQPHKIYCRDEMGTKVWLFWNDKTFLIAHFINKTEKELILRTIKYKNDTIKAREFNVWVGSSKLKNYQLSEVTHFTIKSKNQEYERPYFNLDSIEIVVQEKNDSLKNSYSSGDEIVIKVYPLKLSKTDTITIAENACVNITFKDGTKTEFGVVIKITMDSIVIANSFNPQMASFHKKEYRIHKYPIEEIAELHLLKSHGYSFKKIKKDEVRIILQKRNKSYNTCPMWYSVNPYTGEIGFYRDWLVEGGFSGIQEEKGKPVWFVQ